LDLKSENEMTAKSKDPKPDYGTDRSECDRRSFLGSLGLGGLILADPACDNAQSSTGSAPLQDGKSANGDAGSIYSEIKVLADRCRYPLSWLEKSYPNVESYRHAAREKVFELFHYAPPTVPPAPETVGRWEAADYIQEKILFSTTPWFRVPANLLIPKGRKGLRPAVVDLHSHGGMFVYGKEKVMPIPEGDPQAVANYRRDNYEGRSTSLALCRRGYVVISIDCFYFGERRTLFADDVKKVGWDRNKYSLEDINYLNHRSSEGEAILARSLFWAGTTWQGIAHWDDIRTVDYLTTRPEVDPRRIGCVGISMGGDRSDYLAGLDDRIQCAVSVGWMSTLRPMIKAHVNTHSFMHFLPGLAHFLDLPDVIGCMAPKPLMVQQCEKDALYPLEGMQESLKKIAAIYGKSGAASMFEGRFYDQPHIFSLKMQEEAFAWLDRWLKP
jgi:dienelactone hydrolase